MYICIFPIILSQQIYFDVTKYYYHWKTRGNPDVICSKKKKNQKKSKKKNQKNQKNQKNLLKQYKSLVLKAMPLNMIKYLLKQYKSLVLRRCPLRASLWWCGWCAACWRLRSTWTVSTTPWCGRWAAAWPASRPPRPTSKVGLSTFI